MRIDYNKGLIEINHSPFYDLAKYKDELSLEMRV